MLAEVKRFSKEYKMAAMEIKRGIKKSGNGETKVLYRPD